MLSTLSRRAVSSCRASPRAFSSGGGTLTVDNPYTGDTYCTVPLADSAGASAMVTQASSVQKEWAASSLDERVALCKRFMDALEDMRHDIAVDITGQMGKTYGAAFGEVGGVYERCQGMMDLAPSVLADKHIADKAGCERLIRREPVGVVLCVAPWNYPLLTAVNTIVPAILAGNSVVLKHSSRTPLCAEHFETAFSKAGAPEGLVTALHCNHQVVDEVISNPDIGFVAFTGSVGGGFSVNQSVARTRFINTTLELGGKDPAYVAHDADPAAAAEALVDGAMYNAGQSCCGIERVYVHKSHYNEFVEAASGHVAAYVQGDPMDESTSMGPMAQASGVRDLEAQVTDALDKGARLVHGGSAGVNDAAGKGRFFPPTLLANCTHEMEVMMEESFGPILPVMAVDSEEEAIEKMSDSPYGLTAAIFTQDKDLAMRVGSKVPTGTFFMNRCDYLDPELPWTAGGEHTGKGVSLSEHGFDGVTKFKGFNLRV